MVVSMVLWFLFGFVFDWYFWSAWIILFGRTSWMRFFVSVFVRFRACCGVILFPCLCCVLRVLHSFVVGMLFWVMVFRISVSICCWFWFVAISLAVAWICMVVFLVSFLGFMSNSWTSRWWRVRKSWCAM